MPILPADPCSFPDGLLEEMEDRKRLTLSVLQTKPRQEKALARHLHSQQVPFYLPLYKKNSRIRGKVVDSYLPLFAGYLFLAAPPGELSRGAFNRHVARSLPVPDQDGLWRDLGQIDTLIRTGFPISPQKELAPG